MFLPLNTAYTASEISYFLEDASPSLFVCSSTSLTALEPIAKKLGVSTVLTLDADGSGSLSDFSKTLDDQPFEAIPRSENDLA